MAEKFTIPRMVKGTVEEGIVIYSSGDYGRPLLSGKEAGEGLVRLVEMDRGKGYAPWSIRPLCSICKNSSESSRGENGEENKAS